MHTFQLTGTHSFPLRGFFLLIGLYRNVLSCPMLTETALLTRHISDVDTSYGQRNHRIISNNECGHYHAQFLCYAPCPPMCQRTSWSEHLNVLNYNISDKKWLGSKVNAELAYKSYRYSTTDRAELRILTVIESDEYVFFALQFLFTCALLFSESPCPEVRCSLQRQGLNQKFSIT